MCGRYALGIRAAFVRHQLQQQGLPVDDAPEDDQVRETYNFPPGAFGLVYRADVPDHGVDNEQTGPQHHEEAGDSVNQSVADKSDHHHHHQQQHNHHSENYKYQLKAMKWGLIPSWTKRSPDYGSMLRTINCRDDSLIENKGLWNTMKRRKRCIVVAQGFYEWLKKGPGGKEKIPHFVKRKDGNLMCFAGLWDCVKYEDAEEKLYTYTVITTNSNKQLSFLHDRMPVILDPNTDAMRRWLDPTQNKWTPELQSILKPYEDGLDCYPVNKEVGKVGNNSPDFIVPIDSKENKKNIANFFGNAEKQKQARVEPKVEYEDEEDRKTKDHDSSENHAPVPVPGARSEDLKRKHENDNDNDNEEKPAKNVKTESTTIKKAASPAKTSSVKRTRSATSNDGATLKKSPGNKAADGSQRITDFFAK